MPTLTHPFDPETFYELTEDGHIRVSKGDAEGFFTREGVHVSGAIRHADPQLCVWVGNNPGDANQQMKEGATTINAKRSDPRA